jgi:hypothetical protein
VPWRQHPLITEDAEAAAFRVLTLLLAVCEQAMDALEPVPAAIDTHTAVTTLRDHLFTALSSRSFGSSA